jgi:hypothetical protein
VQLLIKTSSFYLVRQLHNYELKQNKATGFGLFVPRPSSGSLPGLRKGQDLDLFFLQGVSMLIIYFGIKTYKINIDNLGDKIHKMVSKVYTKDVCVCL